MTKRAIDQLIGLLEVERAALLGGDFDTVGALVEEKEDLVTQFADVNGEELRLLSVALAHNARLFAAARDGVMTVLRTLEQQKAARTQLSSYDASGQATQIASSIRKTERRF